MDLPAWRGDADVTPTAVAELRALGNGLDLVQAVRSAAAWWTSNPGKVRDRRSCLLTLRNWVRGDGRDLFKRAAGIGVAPVEDADVVARHREAHMRALASPRGVAS